jgi:hypothetical protein
LQFVYDGEFKSRGKLGEEDVIVIPIFGVFFSILFRRSRGDSLRRSAILPEPFGLVLSCKWPSAEGEHGKLSNHPATAWSLEIETPQMS